MMKVSVSQLKKKLKDQGLNQDVKLSWRKQADGKVFHREEGKKKEEEEKKKKEEGEKKKKKEEEEEEEKEEEKEKFPLCVKA